MKTCILLTLTTLLLLESGIAGAWSQWRGPARDGKVAAGTGAWPESISGDRLAEQWRVDLAEGYSSPIVAGNRVITVETKDAESEVTRAFDRETGKELWNTDWKGAMKVPFFAKKNGSWVRATPAAAGDAVLVSGMRDVLVRLNADGGEEAWRIDFVEREGTELPAFGYCSSPLIDGNAAYVQAGSAVAKLDLKTGKTLWRAMEDRRAMFGSAFSSPIIATIHGKRQIVAQTRSTLGGIDPETGKVLWSTPVEAFRGMNILTPVVIGDRVFTSTYGGGSFMFEVARSDMGFSVDQVWNKKKIEGYMASPVVIGDHLYHLGRDKKLYCLEAATGNVAWSTKEKFGEYLSMVANGNRILALDQRGLLLLFEAAPEAYRELDRRELGDEPTWAHLAVDGPDVYVRGLRSLTAFRWE